MFNYKTTLNFLKRMIFSRLYGPNTFYLEVEVEYVVVITLSVVVDFVVEAVDEVVKGFGVGGIKDVFKFWEDIDGSSDLFCTILFWTKTSFGPVNISENDLGVGVDLTMTFLSSFLGFFTSDAEIMILLFVELISM